jgi:hypothetical protein
LHSSLEHFQTDRSGQRLGKCGIKKQRVFAQSENTLGFYATRGGKIPARLWHNKGAAGMKHSHDRKTRSPTAG